MTKNHVEVTESTESATALVETTEGGEISLSQALHTNIRFASAAYRGGAETGAARRLTWLTGNNQCFEAHGKQALPPGRGWIIDQPDEEAGLLPDDYELIDAMEALCEQGKAAPCIVVHPESGKPRRVPSWALPVLTLFVICQGIPSRAEMRDPKERWGIAYGWNPAKNRSELILQCFVKELLDSGYAGIFLAKFSGMVTDRILACLKAQEYVLNFADALRARSGDDRPVAYYAYGLPIACSQRTLTAGREGQSTEIYYPVPLIPRLSVRDPEPGLAYLASVAITEDQAALLEVDNRVEHTATWSVEKSRRIAGGVSDDQAGPTDSGDDEVPF
jgi:hypothetical protein